MRWCMGTTATNAYGGETTDMKSGGNILGAWAIVAIATVAPSRWLVQLV